MESYINQVDFFKGNDPEKIAQEYGTPYMYIMKKSSASIWMQWRRSLRNIPIQRIIL